tara:strand:- start:6 stop:233 length:228 start_codon:yes stop_codon:yes gene_type:complete
VDHPSLELPGVALPLRHWQWGITPEMTPAAFLSEQAGFQQQSTCALTVVEIQQQVELPATGFFQLMLLIEGLSIQ